MPYGISPPLMKYIGKSVVKRKHPPLHGPTRPSEQQAYALSILKKAGFKIGPGVNLTPKKG